MIERLISVFGLLVLMGIAYLFSTNRSAIRYRTVLWGVGLQVLFAVIILRPGNDSFVAMFLLAALIQLYLFEPELRRRLSSPWLAGAAVLLATAAAVAVLMLLEGWRIATVALALGALALVAALALRRAAAVRPLVGVLLVAGVAYLWSHGVDGQTVFRALSERVAAFLALSNQGAEFLFGNLVHDRYWRTPPGSPWPGFGVQFAFTVLPTIIFFSAFISVLYHLGVVQLLITAMARFMHWSMKTSGSETMSVSGNIFVGQTESPFLIKPFLERMTTSELHAVMVGGFATIAGGVLAGYIQMGVNPGHLIAASVMSAPAALVIAKLLVPETEHSETAGDVEIPAIESGDNLVGAAASGTADGLKLALNVGAMLIAFIALIAVVDSVLGYGDQLVDGRLLEKPFVADDPACLEATCVGEYRGVFPGRLKTLFGVLLSPLAWVMGVPWKDAMLVGNLLGIKLAVNEFVSYGILGNHIRLGDLELRSITIATYALCGFANFSSIGIQIGGIGALAPSRRGDLARVGVRAMFGGALASWMTATVAGILL